MKNMSYNSFFCGKTLEKERVKQGYKSKWSFAKKMSEYEPKVASSNIWQWEKTGAQPALKYVALIAHILKKPIGFFLIENKKAPQDH